MVALPIRANQIESSGGMVGFCVQDESGLVSRQKTREALVIALLVCRHGQQSTLVVTKRRNSTGQITAPQQDSPVNFQASRFCNILGPKDEDPTCWFQYPRRVDSDILGCRISMLLWTSGPRRSATNEAHLEAPAKAGFAAAGGRPVYARNWVSCVA